MQDRKNIAIFAVLQSQLSYKISDHSKVRRCMKNPKRTCSVAVIGCIQSQVGGGVRLKRAVRKALHYIICDRVGENSRM